MSEDTRVLIVDHGRFSALISKMLVGKFATETAEDGLQAIKALRTTPPNILIVDQDIPGNGIRLAELVGMSPKYKDVSVVLTSGKPSPDTIIRAKNAGVSSYLAKPFRPSELVNRIEGALLNQAAAAATATSESASGEDGKEDAAASAAGGEGTEDDEGEEESGSAGDIRSKVKNIDGLPQFPATHAEIMKLSKSDESSSEDLAEKIQLDPGFLATVLKLANSSYYGFSKKTDSLQLAVTRLGMEEIGNLVMAAQVFEKLGGNDEGSALDMAGLWKHSVGTAFIARAVSKKLQTEVDASFLGGMLHDLGKIVLDRFFADYYGAVVDTVKSESMSLYQAEMEILGVSHAEVGGLLAESWAFSKNFQNCMTHHHLPRGTRRHQRLVCVIHLADVLCHQLEFGSGGDEQVPDVDESALDRFSIGDRGLTTLKEVAEADLEDAESFLSGLAK